MALINLISTLFHAPPLDTIIILYQASLLLLSLSFLAAHMCVYTQTNWKSSLPSADPILNFVYRFNFVTLASSFIIIRSQWFFSRHMPHPCIPFCRSLTTSTTTTMTIATKKQKQWQTSEMNEWMRVSATERKRKKSRMK